jgi:hypothetical protein
MVSNGYARLSSPSDLVTSVSSNSVTVITPGAGCSITSTATVSTAVAADGATFFAAARLGLALATARFAAFFPRAALDSFLALGSNFAPFLFWTFDDFFLRLAIVDPLFWLALRKLIDDRSKDNQLRVAATHSTGYQQTFSGFICPYPPHLSTLHVRR